MHVCREKIGDGTLLTIIRDLNEGEIYLYFYHDFQYLVTFNLKTELAKGDHVYEILHFFLPMPNLKDCVITKLLKIACS